MDKISSAKECMRERKIWKFEDNQTEIVKSIYNRSEEKSLGETSEEKANRIRKEKKGENVQ